SEEKVPMPPTLNSIRIMTMHLAKGLKFPVVIAPWLELEGNAGDIPIFVKEMKLLARPCPEMGDLYYERLAAGVREALHLLYVTWTRPKDELYAFITSTKRKFKSAEALDSMLKDIPLVSGEPVPCRLDEPSEPESSFPGARSEKAEPSECSERPLGWLPDLKIFRAPKDVMRQTASQRGILAHRCLECLLLSGEPCTDKDILSAVSQGMTSVPFPVHDPSAAKDELLDIVKWVCSLPETSRWLKWGIPEQEIMDASGNVFRADLIVDDGRRVTVVDYKTGEIKDDHRKQITHYRQMLAEAQPLPVEAVLVYLDRRVVEYVDA
ncbi:MAG: hypothetical protein J5828_03570, partial [Desulfovibrionaceae bacterium]|nr:hypothetical protein [Desulfovibrionaceae bacterium]